MKGSEVIGIPASNDNINGMHYWIDQATANMHSGVTAVEYKNGEHVQHFKAANIQLNEAKRLGKMFVGVT